MLIIKLVLCVLTDQQPQGVTSRSHDNTDYHNTIYGTRSSTSATNGNIVNNVTGASSVTNMNTAAMSPTSSSSGTTSPTKTTGRWPVCFSQSPTTTQPSMCVCLFVCVVYDLSLDVQSTARMSSVTSSVATAITVSSPTSENTVIASVCVCVCVFVRVCVCMCMRACVCDHLMPGAIYRIAQNSGGGKLWRIWRIRSNLPKFYPSKFT